MNDLKRTKITAPAIPVRGNDIDTDRIIPARFLKCVTFDGLGEHAFEDDRLQLKQKGQTHPIDNPKFANAKIMLANKNFGCGSSREHAPQSIMRWGKGIDAIIAESFAEIFFGNCVTLGVPCLVADETTIQHLMSYAETHPNEPLAIDIEKKTVKAGNDTYPLTLADGPRKAFLEGTWDSTAELLAAKDQIAATAAKLPYFNGWK
ncbi:MAG TPA: 3-isopropylmalate dehydratase small subunit [Candidatus Sumerlaeota bacterium]|nr:3-isopropylmalate dehydratase small subunit [Candidatus Sumerlaeota bacterium]HNM45529.1 3-isopropylmalate dehydratase small subunit [Candidatus Sumerlaeota bacterium]